MPAPTETQIQRKILDSAILMKETHKFAGINATNFDTLWTTAIGDAATDYDLEFQAAIFAKRKAYNECLRQDANVINPLFSAYAKKIKVPEADGGNQGNAIINRLYDWFVNLLPGAPGVQTITSRQFAYGTPAAVGSPIGTGTIYRLNKDAYNYDLEAQFPDTKTARVVADAQTTGGGNRHEETFEFRSDVASRDGLLILGSGEVANPQASSARNSVLVNASFESSSPDPVLGTPSTPTTVTAWNLDNLASFALNADRYYRDYVGLGQTLPRSLEFLANASINQLFAANRKPLATNRPYFVQVAAFRKTACDGTLTLFIGPQAPFAPTTALTCALGSGAGNVDNGIHKYAITFLSRSGESLIGIDSGTVNVVDKTVNGKVALSAIPVGAAPASTAITNPVIQRRVYRTKAGGSTYFLLTTIDDNTSTTYTDNTADSALGANPLAALVSTQSVSVDVTTKTDGTWFTLQLPLGTGNWYQTWQAQDLAIWCTLTGRTTGSLPIDEVLVVPFFPFGGGWYCIIGGRTPYLRNDQWNWTDDCLKGTSAVVLQETLWRVYGTYLPALPAAPAGAPAAALAGAGAGNVNNGAHTYAVTFVCNGLESAAGATVVATVVDKTVNGKVALTAIPTGGTGITSRKVYRSAAGTTTPLLLLTTIADNSTTTYTDNTADSGLGAASPVGVSWKDV